MGQALYRKYRSKSLDEIVGQEHITQTLKRAIASGRIAHAYLFTGPRGVGKTSIARILAHELNQVPYVGEDNHLDIIEIDAASNGGVEEVRDLRECIHIAPSSGKYKVYIIDEVHMMTTSAFNALLKTLEEPPAHTIFILATTEAHKLPATIVSRTQRFTFKPVPRDVVAKHLRYIATQENINITDDALALIAEHSEGSFRDSISMLDQAGSSEQTVDAPFIEQLLGIPAIATVAELLQLLAGHDAQGIVARLQQLHTQGYQATALTKQLAASLRTAYLQTKSSDEKRHIIALLTKLIEVPAASYPDQLLELILMEAAIEPGSPTPTVTAAAPTPQKAPAPSIPQLSALAAIPTIAPLPVVVMNTVATTEQPPAEAAADQPTGTGVLTDGQWQAVLTALGKQYNTLYGIIRMARPEFTPGSIRLTFGFAFHQKRANDTKNKQILMAVIENTTGERLSIECFFDKTITPPGPPPHAPAAATPSAAPTPVAIAAPAIATINTVFGGSEVLPS